MINIANIFKGATQQLRSLKLLLVILYVPSILLFLGVGIFSKIVPHLTIYGLLGDVTEIGDLPFYAGGVSQLGLLLWGSAATLCFFLYFTLRKMNATRKETLRLFLFSGCLTGYLMLDDTYLLHEEFFPHFFIPEKLMLILVGLAMLSLLYFNRNEILRGEYGLIMLAYVLFGISILFDAIPRSMYENLYLFEKAEKLVEDGAKFSAIITLIAFFARYGYQQLSQQILEKTSK